jgi:hypothetical protein
MTMMMMKNTPAFKLYNGILVKKEEATMDAKV